MTSTSFVLVLASQAIAQTPNENEIEEFSIQPASVTELRLGADSLQDTTLPVSDSRLTDQWLSEELAVEEGTHLDYPFSSDLGFEDRLISQMSEAGNAPIAFRQAPGALVSAASLLTLQQAEDTSTDLTHLFKPEHVPSIDLRRFLLAEQVSLETAEMEEQAAIDAIEIAVDGEEFPSSEVANGQAMEEETANLDLPDINSTHIDPELGILRLRPLASRDMETGTSAALLDPELGVLRLRNLPQSAEREAARSEDSVFLQGYLSFFNGNNLLARTEPLSDTTMQTGLTFRAVPRLGPRTFLVGTAGGSLLKYADHGEFNYHELDLSLGLYHWLTRRTYVDVGWRNQQFFTEGGGDRFLSDHQLRVAVGRTDHLTPDLKLDSAYQLQSSWSDPRERSRLTNRLTVGLSHPITSQLDASLSYQLALIDFTQQDRYDSYHQILAQLQFSLSEEATLTIFGGGRLGDSTHSLIDFDSTLLGMSFAMNFALF